MRGLGLIGCYKLSEMQKYYEMVKDNWRSLSYRKAINTLKTQSRKVCFADDARE